MKKTVIFLGYECNNKCIFCCHEHRRGNVKAKNYKEVKEDLIKAKKDGSDYIELIGGEPTIRKDIFKIVSFAKVLNFEIIMFATNGRMLSSKPFAEKILKSGANHIVFSIHGHTKELHDSLTQAKGSFDQLIKGINNLKELGFKQIGSNTTIIKQNYKHLLEIGKLIDNLGIVNSEFIFVDPTSGAAKTNFDLLVPSYEEVSKNINELLEFGKQKNKDHWDIRYYLPCLIEEKYHNQISELHESKIFENTKHIAPDFKNNDSSKNRKEISRTKINKCRECPYENFCEGYWKEYLKKKPEQNLFNFHGIKAAYIHVSDICNFNCKTCNLPETRKKSFTETSIILNKIKTAKELGFPNLIFTGLEVIIHPDLLKILEFASAQKFEIINFNTNGLAFNQPHIIKKLEKAKNKGLLNNINLAISINFYDENSFQDWSGHNKEMFKNWCKGFKEYIKINNNLIIDHILKKDCETEKVLKFIHEEFPETKTAHLRIINLMPFGKTKDKEYNSINYSLIEKSNKIKQILNLHPGKIEFEGFPICTFSQEDLKSEKFTIYNFQLKTNEDNLPTDYDPNIYGEYFGNEPSNWEIDLEKLKDAYSKMFTELDECKTCHYRPKCYNIQKEYLKFNPKNKTNEELKYLKKSNW